MFCPKCGNSLQDGAKFCPKCGTSVKAAAVTAEKTKTAPKTAEAKPAGTKIKFTDAIREVIKNPKKLIPTAVLALIWIIFSMMSGFGVNIPVLGFLYTLTYSSGGMYGGIFGLIGGIFGKALFAAVVTGIVSSICEKKNPLSGLKSGLKKGTFSGMKSASPLLIGAGVGLILYWIFNVTAAKRNCAVAVAGAFAALSAAGKQNGLAFSLTLSAFRKLTKGKTPSATDVSRTLSGAAAGFAAGFALTFVRSSWLLAGAGIAVLAAGIVLSVTGGKGMKKAASTAAVFVLMFAVALPLISVPALAAKNDSYTLTFDDKYKQNDIKYDNRRSDDPDSFIYYSFVEAGKITVEKTGSGYEFTLPAYTAQYGHTSLTVPECRFTGTDFHKQEESDDQIALACVSNFTGEFDGSVTAVYSADNGHTTYFTYDYSNIRLKLYSFDIPKDNKLYTPLTYDLNETRQTETATYTDFKQNKSSSYMTYGAVIDGYNFKNLAEDPNTGKNSGGDTEEDEGDDYVPYHGRLTYTNGAKNKYGQPFPDLMDFDMDGDIDYGDRVLQHELVHNPYYLDQPESKGMIALTAILTAIFGGLAGAAAGTAGGAAGAAAGAAAEIAVETAAEAAAQTLSFGDLGRYITRDSDGDLNVTDPATGEKRLYTANGDGTYTNPLTGATYTEEELKASVDSREENAGLIRADQQTANEAINAQRADNQKLSAYNEEYLKEKARIEEEEKREDYLNSLGEKYGVYSGDENEIRAKIGAEQGKAEIEHYENMAYAEEINDKKEYLETVEKSADVGVDVLAEVTGRKDIKNAYTFLKETASKGSEAYAEGRSVVGGIAQGAVNGAISVGQDSVDGATAKLMANMAGNAYKNALDAQIKGENVTEAAFKGVGEGALDAAVDSMFDIVGGGVEDVLGDSGDDVIKNVLGTDVTKAAFAGGTKTLANDLAKDAVKDAFKMPGDDD